MARTTTRIALCVAAAVACLVAGGGDAAAKPCVPVAHLTGDAEVVADLAAALIARSVTVEEHSDCGVVTARVTKDETHIVVRVTDADGRNAQRSADDIDGAATIIESWLRSDLAAPLLAARLGPARPKAGRSKAPPLVAGTAERTRTVGVGAGLDLGFGVDGSVWSGARVEGCVTFGRVCAGLLVRYSIDNRIAGKAEELDNDRRLLDTMAVVQMPFSRGRWELNPGVGLGESRVSSVKDDEDEDGEEIDESTSGVRLRVHAGVSYRLTGGWQLRADAAASVVAFSDGDFIEDGPGEDMDESMGGMPLLHTWLGIGLVYEGL